MTKPMHDIQDVHECPRCAKSWDGLEIPDGLQSHSRMVYRTREDAEAGAKAYGWTPENKRRFKENVVGVETDKYDGISYWLCTHCGAYFDRWTGHEIESTAIC